MTTGIVIKSTGSWYEVLLNDEVVKARIKGKFRQKGLRTTNPVSVGDIVGLEPEGENYVIHHIEPKKNYIIRKSTKLSKRYHIIASNIDQLAIVTTIVKPNITIGFIDRMLVTAEAYNIPAIIVFNKIDLYSKENLMELAYYQSLYESIGYKTMAVSGTTGYHMNELKDALSDKITLLSGHSGVGKSTLTNQVQPDLFLRTSDVSDTNDKGKHTTTFAEMHRLPNISDNTFIIDTPGVRSFGIIDFEREHLGHYFPEIRARMHDCKFNNCVHINEPHCAVKTAVENEEIPISRYENYLDMYNDENLEKEY